MEQIYIFLNKSVLVQVLQRFELQVFVFEQGAQLVVLFADLANPFLVELRKLLQEMYFAQEMMVTDLELLFLFVKGTFFYFLTDDQSVELDQFPLLKTVEEFVLEEKVDFFNFAKDDLTELLGEALQLVELFIGGVRDLDVGVVFVSDENDGVLEILERFEQIF